MSTETTVESIDTTGLRALADACTPGPWVPKRNQVGVMNLLDFARRPAAFMVSSDHLVGVLHSDARPPNFEADATFIAAAREAVPALVDEVDRLRADLEVGGAEWSRLAEEHDSLAGKAAAAAVWEERARRAEAALDRVRGLAWGGLALGVGSAGPEVLDLANDVLATIDGPPHADA